MTLSDIVSIVLNPACWLQDGPYSAAWDAECRRMLAEKTPITVKDGYEAKWGPYHIWIENHPYASFTLYRSDDGDGIEKHLKALRPSRAVILRAGGALVKKARYDAELDMAAFIAGKSQRANDTP